MRMWMELPSWGRQSLMLHLNLCSVCVKCCHWLSLSRLCSSNVRNDPFMFLFLFTDWVSFVTVIFYSILLSATTIELGGLVILSPSHTFSILNIIGKCASLPPPSPSFVFLLLLLLNSCSQSNCALAILLCVWCVKWVVYLIVLFSEALSNDHSDTTLYEYALNKRRNEQCFSLNVGIESFVCVIWAIDSGVFQATWCCL